MTAKVQYLKMYRQQFARQQLFGEFRSNLRLGGVATSVKLLSQERALAVKAAKVMGLDVAGVDIIRSARGDQA